MDRDEFMELVYETFADEPDNVLANGIIEAADAYAEHEKAQLSCEGTIISRQWLLECVDEGWIKFDTEEDANRFIHLVRDIAPGVQSVATDTNVGDTISRQEAIDALAEALKQIDVLDIEDVGLVLSALPAAQPEPQWISVTERLPDNADHPGAFCPRYQVVTPYGVTEGWYRPHDHEKGGQWFALFWFMSQIYEIWNIDFERGDVPKVIGEAPVMEWRPLPEPYKPNK